MKVAEIKTAKKISEHLYQIGQDIEPEDLLRIIRILSGKGKELGNYYYHGESKFYFTEVAGITRKEFNQILNTTREIYPSLEDIIDDNFTREQLIDQLSPIVKVKRSTTKRELLYKALDEEILYELFKELIVGKKCQEWEEYIDGKILIPSLDKEFQIIFSEKSPWKKPVSNKSFTQFWILWRNSKSHMEIEDYHTKQYGDSLFLNMKDNDEVLIRSIKEVARGQSKTKDDSEFQLDIREKEVSHTDIGLAENEGIKYENDIDKLTQYFGKRRGSKFETFSSGLKEMANNKLIKKLLEKKFLISAYNYSEDTFIGRPLDKPTFEGIASHLRLEYMEGKNIICKVQEKETPEVISAIWEMSGEYNKTFQLRILDERRNKKC